MISLLVAHDVNRVIGVDNEMPWHIPEELAYFKEKTMGKAMIMGRKTFDSIGRVLPGRLNIIITREEDYQVENAAVVHNLQEAVKAAVAYNADEVMIIGGAQIFEQSMELADRLYITEIQNAYPGDVYFPQHGEAFALTSESPVQHAADGTTYVYKVYDRVKRTEEY